MSPTELLEQWNKQFSGTMKLKIDEVKSIYQKIDSTDNTELKDWYFEKIILGTQHVVYNYLKESGIYLLSSREFDTEDIISATYESWIENIKTEKVKDVSYFSRIMHTKTFSDLVIKKIGSISKEKVLFGECNKITKKTYMYGLTDIEFEDLFIRYYHLKKESQQLSYKQKISIFDNYKEDFTENDLNNVKVEFIHLFDNMYDYLECTLDDINISDTNLKKYIKLITNNVMTDEMSDNLIINTDLESNIIKKEKNDLFTEIMSELTEKEKNTIRLRFGFENGHCKSLEEIGEIFCFTRERIRLLESRALCKIRRSPSIKKLKDYSFL